VSDVRARYQLMLERVRQLPEVESAALRSTVVLGERGGTVTGIGRTVDDPNGCCHAAVAVSPEYFATVGLPILRGRPFTSADSQPGAPRVVILDEDLTTRLFADGDAIGKCVNVFFSRDCHEVVGVSASGRGKLLKKGQLDTEFFLPFSESSAERAVPQSLLVRPRSSSRRSTTAIATAIRSAAPDLPYVNIQPFAELANMEARSWRMGATILGIFGSLAIVLAAVGIYAALAFSIRQRTPEIGVRVAFGATPRNIVNMIFARVIVVAGLGWMAGAAATFMLTRYMRSLLFDVAPGDGVTFATASAVVLAAAFAGSVVPALRASRVDPAAALRME
jgi:MacB-like periplasmic core domain